MEGFEILYLFQPKKIAKSLEWRKTEMKKTLYEKSSTKKFRKNVKTMMTVESREPSVKGELIVYGS